MPHPCVAIGFVGAVLDTGQGPDRWEKWRPTVALCQHEDLLLSRFEMLSQKKFTSLAQRVVEDIQSISPETSVRIHHVEFDDAWDFEQVYGQLHDWAKSYPFRPEE